MKEWSQVFFLRNYISLESPGVKSIVNEYKIVVIDDDKSLVKLLETELSRRGYQVICALDGEGGLETVINCKPDLIILDVLLPGGDGYDVLRSIKKNNVTKNIPVVMLTALGLEEDIEKGMCLGAAHYIVKPFRITPFLKCIEMTLRQNARIH